MVKVEMIIKELNEIFEQDFELLEQDGNQMFFSGNDAYNVYLDVESGRVYEFDYPMWCFTGIELEC